MKFIRIIIHSLIENNEEEKQKKFVLTKKYRIEFPLNFTNDKNIPHGSTLYFSELPEWAKNNPRLVVELVEVEEEIEEE